MHGLTFADADPAAVAGQLDRNSIHLWRMPYSPSEGRAPLLELLGAYVGRPASGIVLERDARGKPRMTEGRIPGAGGQPLEFNWSHSGDYALAALSAGLPLGVDVERTDKKLRALALARRYFDPAESEVLASLSPPDLQRAFIGLWCAKEAVLKAVGEGLSFGLARLAFRWQSGMEWDLGRIDPALGRKQDWRLHGFDAAPGYRGVLAWRGPARTIAAFRMARPDGT